MQVRFAVAAAVAGSLAFASAPASADLVAITFQGSITGLDQPQLLPAALQALQAGDAFEYTLVMDTALGAGLAEDGYLLEESGYVSSHLTMGTLSSATSTGHFEYLEIGNNQEGVDFIGTADFGGGAALFVPDDIISVNASFASTVLSEAAIPTLLDAAALPADFENFLYQAPFIEGVGQGAVLGMVSRVTAAVVPAPGVGLVGIAGLFALRRRR